MKFKMKITIEKHNKANKRDKSRFWHEFLIKAKQ